MRIREWLRCLVLATVWMFPTLAAGEDQPAIRVSEHQVAMSDGVQLATDVYLPGDGQGAYPVIVARTPYNKAGGAGFGKLVCQRGYALVYQDLRGRFKSEGNHAIIFGND